MRLNIYGAEYEFLESSREYLLGYLISDEHLPDIYRGIANCYLAECFKLTSIRREIELPGE